MTKSDQAQPKKCVIYCRVSSVRQVVEGHGNQSQEKLCRNYAKSNNYEVLDVFSEEGVSGGLFERPSMRRLLAFLDKRTGLHPTEPPIVVVFDDLKRFARNVEVHFSLKKEIYGRNGIVESPNFKFEDSPMGKFSETVLAASAELERNQNRRQVIQKMKARLEAGYWSFCPSRSFKYIKVPAHGKLLALREPYASIHRQALEGYERCEFGTITEVRDFIVSKYREHRLIDTITIRNTKKLMQNPLNAGYIEYKPWEVSRREGQHEGFISPETYHNVQEKLKIGGRRSPRRDYSVDFPLRGYVVCGSCGKLLTASWNRGRSKRYPNYVCHGKGCPLRYKSIPRHKIEPEFEELLSESALDKCILDLARAVFTDVWEDKGKRMTESYTRTDQKIESLDEKISSLVDRISKTSKEVLIQAYEKEIEELAKEKHNLTSNQISPDLDENKFGTALDNVFTTLQNPLALWRSNNLSDKQTIVQMFFDKPLEYNHNNGFGTASLCDEINLIKGFATSKVGLVDTITKSWNRLYEYVLKWDTTQDYSKIVA